MNRYEVKGISEGRIADDIVNESCIGRYRDGILDAVEYVSGEFDGKIFLRVGKRFVPEPPLPNQRVLRSLIDATVTQ